MGRINEVKSFSPLGVKIQQFLYMKRLVYLNLFFPVVANSKGFLKETNSPFTLWSSDSFFEGQ